MNQPRQPVTAEQMETITAVLGIDAATFRSTKLGQYIFDQISVREDKLLEELIEISLKSSDLAVARQAMNIQMHRMLPKFIEEAVGAGYAAERNIDQQEAAQQEF